MIQIHLIFDYISSLLSKQPLEFDHKTCLYITLLEDLKSLEKYHKSILTVDKWMFEIDIAEKYFGADMTKKNNVLIYCKKSINSKPIKLSMEEKLNKKKAMIESNKNLLNVLRKTDLNHRLLLWTNRSENEQVRFRLNEIRSLLDLSLYTHEQLNSQNTINLTKVNTILTHMKSVEVQLQNRVIDFQSSVDQLNKCIEEISKEILTDFTINNSKKEYNMKKKLCINVMNPEILLNAFTEQRKIIDSFNQAEMIQPLRTLSQNESLFNFNLNDFLIIFNLAKEKFTMNIDQNCNIVTSLNTLVNNLSGMEKTFSANLRSIVRLIITVRNERNVSTTILIKLIGELNELKKTHNSLLSYYHQSDNFKDKCNENISDLENKIRKSHDQLTKTTRKNEMLNDVLQRSDTFADTASQKYSNQLNSTHQIFLSGDHLSKKVQKIENEFDEQLIKRKKIMSEWFEKKRSSMEVIVKKKYQKTVEMRAFIMSYNKKIKTYKRYKTELRQLNASIENALNDLLIHHTIIYENHGRNLEHFKDEKLEFTKYIRFYNTELNKIYLEDKRIDNYSKHIAPNMRIQKTDLNEKLLQITSANESLKKGLDKKKK